MNNNKNNGSQQQNSNSEISGNNPFGGMNFGNINHGNMNFGNMNFGNMNFGNGFGNPYFVNQKFYNQSLNSGNSDNVFNNNFDDKNLQQPNLNSINKQNMNGGGYTPYNQNGNNNPFPYNGNFNSNNNNFDDKNPQPIQLINPIQTYESQQNRVTVEPIQIQQNSQQLNTNNPSGVTFTAPQSDIDNEEEIEKLLKDLHYIDQSGQQVCMQDCVDKKGDIFSNMNEFLVDFGFHSKNYIEINYKLLYKYFEKQTGIKEEEAIKSKKIEKLKECYETGKNGRKKNEINSIINEFKKEGIIIEQNDNEYTIEFKDYNEKIKEFLEKNLDKIGMIFGYDKIDNICNKFNEGRINSYYEITEECGNFWNYYKCVKFKRYNLNNEDLKEISDRVKLQEIYKDFKSLREEMIKQFNKKLEPFGFYVDSRGTMSFKYRMFNDSNKKEELKQLLDKNGYGEYYNKYAEEEKNYNEYSKQLEKLYGIKLYFNGGTLMCNIGYIEIDESNRNDIVKLLEQAGCKPAEEILKKEEEKREKYYHKSACYTRIGSSNDDDIILCYLKHSPITYTAPTFDQREYKKNKIYYLQRGIYDLTLSGKSNDIPYFIYSIMHHSKELELEDKENIKIKYNYRLNEVDGNKLEYDEYSLKEMEEEFIIESSTPERKFEMLTEKMIYDENITNTNLFDCMKLNDGNENLKGDINNAFRLLGVQGNRIVEKNLEFLFQQLGKKYSDYDIKEFKRFYEMGVAERKQKEEEEKKNQQQTSINSLNQQQTNIPRFPSNNINSNTYQTQN